MLVYCKLRGEMVCIGVTCGWIVCPIVVCDDNNCNKVVISVLLVLPI